MKSVKEIEQEVRVSLEEYLNTPLIQEARDVLAMVRAGIQSYFQHGHCLPDKALKFPEDIAFEAPNGTIGVNMEKLSEWCALLPWLEVPDSRNARARWILEYQYGKAYADTIEEVQFTAAGGLQFRLMQPANFIEIDLKIEEEDNG